jgi:hypothetical protein
MSKKIEDYLKYYIGQKCQTSEGIGPLTIVGDHERGEDCEVSIVNTDEESGFYGEWTEFQIEHHLIKPLLRPLSSMTDEEMKEIWQIVFGKAFRETGQIVWFDKEDRSTSKRWVLMSGVDRLGICLNGDVWADIDLFNYKFNPHSVTHYLLSRGFDLFGLIEAGLAINASTTNTDKI